MPNGMSGFEVCSRIRMLWKAARLPVVVLTASDELEDLEKSMQLGCSDYIRKVRRVTARWSAGARSGGLKVA